jgi:hypothetical protein
MKAPALFLPTLALVIAGCAFPVEKKTVVETPPPVVHEQKEVIVEHPAPLLPSCSYGGIDYSDGSFSCQGGLEYRCDDGAWVGRLRSC